MKGLYRKQYRKEKEIYRKEVFFVKTGMSRKKIMYR